MSKFAAIEARATQYPASTNDVVWLVERVRELRGALQGLGALYPTGVLCFCDMRIGNPMYRNHTQFCQRAQVALAALDAPNLPVETH